jgi:hypothetical protein
MMIDRNLLERFRFFHKHAGGVVGEAAVGALNLARAEKWAEDNGLAVHWEDEEDMDVTWMDQRQLERLARGIDFMLFAVLTTEEVVEEREGLQGIPSHAPVYGSIGGVHLGPDGINDPYARVVAAELALEAQWDSCLMERAVAD